MTEATTTEVEETTPKTALYEIMFILNPELGEKKTEEEIVEIKKLITDNDGKVGFEDIWGIREFAYTIKNHDSGYYVVLNFEMGPEGLSEFSHPLNLNQNILRYMVTAMPKSYQPITLSEYQAQAEKEEAEREAEKKKERVKKAVKTAGRSEKAEVEKKVEKKEEKVEKIDEPTGEEEKAKKKVEEEKAAKKAEKEKADLDDVDEKLKNIINDPDITL